MKEKQPEKVKKPEGEKGSFGQCILLMNLCLQFFNENRRENSSCSRQNQSLIKEKRMKEKPKEKTQKIDF